MAVPKSRKSRSRTGKKLTHKKLTLQALSTDPVTGKVHIRHHVTADGYYRGKQVLNKEQPDKDDEE